MDWQPINLDALVEELPLAHAATYAMRHGPSGCVLLRLWYGRPDEHAAAGQWEWWVIHPRKWGRLAAICEDGDAGADAPPGLLDRATAAVHELCQTIDETP